MSYDFPEEEYSAAQVSIESGDRIVLYTDGIVDATDTLAEQYRTVRFKKTFSRLFVYSLHPTLCRRHHRASKPPNVCLFSIRHCGHPIHSDMRNKESLGGQTKKQGTGGYAPPLTFN